MVILIVTKGIKMQHTFYDMYKLHWNKVEVVCGFTLEVLLYGRVDLSVHTDTLLFEAVRENILESHRFD